KTDWTWHIESHPVRHSIWPDYPVHDAPERRESLRWRADHTTWPQSPISRPAHTSHQTGQRPAWNRRTPPDSHTKLWHNAVPVNRAESGRYKRQVKPAQTESDKEIADTHQQRL